MSHSLFGTTTMWPLYVSLLRHWQARAAVRSRSPARELPDVSSGRSTHCHSHENMRASPEPSNITLVAQASARGTQPCHSVVR